MRSELGDSPETPPFDSPKTPTRSSPTRRRQVHAVLAASVAEGPPEKAGEHEVSVASDGDQPGEERGPSAVDDEGGADRWRGRPEI
jgi:hypothetical protein